MSPLRGLIFLAVAVSPKHIKSSMMHKQNPKVKHNHFPASLPIPDHSPRFLTTHALSGCPNPKQPQAQRPTTDPKLSNEDPRENIAASSGFLPSLK